MNDGSRAARGRMTRTKRRTVGLDLFGNAIPDVPSARVEGTGKALKVVERREVVVGRGRAARSRPVGGLLLDAGRALAARLMGPRPTLPAPAVERSASPAASGDEPSRPTSTESPASRAEPETEAERWSPGIAERLEYAFRRLHQEFDERERRLEQRLREVHERHGALQAGSSPRRRRFALPLGLAGVAAVGYVLYLVTTMQGSMTDMSRNMVEMNTHMGAMAGDTRAMSQNMESMNRSVTSLNGSVAQMNQQVGAISQAAAPMGQAAQNMSPFMSMMRGMWPF